MLLTFIESLHLLSIVASFLLPFWYKKRSLVRVFFLVLASWVIAIVMLELTLHEAELAGIVVEGDGPKSLFAWFLGWLPSVLAAGIGMACSYLTSKLKRRSRSVDR
jgi:hypothetical protein